MKIANFKLDFVNEELDGGEIILQEEVPILKDDTIESLTKAVQRREYYVLPQAIQKFKDTTLCVLEDK